MALTQRAKLEVRVYGVVVHARREVDGSSTKGNETVTNNQLWVRGRGEANVPAGSLVSL